MSKLIPPRPIYRKERLLAGFLAFAAFLLLFLYRLCAGKLGLNTASFPVVLIAELAVFLLPALFFCLLRGRGYVRYLRLHAPRPAHVLFLVSAFFALFCGCLLLSILCRGTELLGTGTVAFESAYGGGFLEGLGRFFAFALLPAVLEEFFFRGILTAEYERRGAFRAVLMTALLFALIHFDVRNLAVYLFAGILFSLVLFATDSLPAVMLLHALYNTVSFFGQKYLNALYDFTGSVELFLFFLVLLFLVSLLIFCREGWKLYRIYDRAGTETPRRAVPYEVQFYTTLDALRDPPILLCIALSVAGMILFF